jgi:hypothetical protein
MKILGLSISRSTLNPGPSTKSAPSLAAAWLRGDDLEQTGTVLTNAYQQVVWVYRAINALADQVSNIPFLFSRGQPGRETLIKSGPLLDFYNRPHRHLNQFQYWERSSASRNWTCSFRSPVFSKPTNASHSRS